MSEPDYWQQFRRRRIARRTLLRAGARAGLGISGLALVGCGADDEKEQATAQVAPAEQAEEQGTEQAVEQAAAAEQADEEEAVAEAPPDPLARFDLNATLRVATGAGPGSLDPQTQAGYGGQAQPNFQHFDRMFAIDESNTPVNGGVSDFEFVDENSALLLHVRPGITFHNGEVLDAEQLKFNIDRNLGRAEYNPEFVSGIGGSLAAVADASIVDEMTLRVELARPSVAIADDLALAIYLVPKGHVTENGDGVVAREPVGSGPFKLDSFAPDEFIKSVRNDDYAFGRDFAFSPRLPFIAAAETRFIPEPQARIAALEAGEVDYAALILPDLAKTFENREGFTVFYYSAARGLHFELPIWLESDPKTGGPNPWRDKRVRIAANLAVDVDAIIENLQTGRENHIYSLAIGQFGFPPELESKRWGYDVERAKQLLTEAGYPDGFEFDLTYGAGLYSGDTAFVQAIAGFLREVGFKVNVVGGDISNYLVQIRAKENLQPFLFPIAAGRNPVQAFRLHTHSKGVFVHPAEVLDDAQTEIDALIERTEAEFDVEKRRALVEEVAIKDYENAADLYLFELVQPNVARDYVEWPIYQNKPPGLEYWNVRVLKEV